MGAASVGTPTPAAAAGRAPTAGVGGATAGAITAQPAPAVVGPAGNPGTSGNLTGSGANNAAVQAVRAEMAKSPIAADILARLEQRGARLEVLSDAQFQQRFPGAAGVFLPSTNQMIVPQGGLANTKKMALTLAHEGLHWLQDNVGNTALAGTGGALGQAIAATGAQGKGANAKDQANMDEAQSYTIQAYIARELGTQDFGFATDKATGKIKSYQEVLAAVRNSPFYN